MTKLANLFLILGVIVGALSAAGSEKAYRVVELDPMVDLSDQFAYVEVTVKPAPGADPRTLVEEGAALDAVAVTNLRNANFERVRVRHPPQDRETVPLAEAQDRVLAEAIVLEGTEQVVRAGRIVDEDFLSRVRDTGIETVRLREAGEASGSGEDRALEDFLGPESADPAPTEGDAAEGDAAESIPADDAAAEGEAAGGDDAAELEDPSSLQLDEDLTLPRRFEAGIFLDADRLATLDDQGLESVPVQVQVAFTWSGWTQRWWFLGAVALMLAGVALKRAARAPADVGGAGAVPAADLRAALLELSLGADRLAADAPAMSAAEIHAAIDPLHDGPLYRLAVGREDAQRALGLAAYAEVYGALAPAERWLSRAWSAAVDGALDEARHCAESAAPAVREALGAWPEA